MPASEPASDLRSDEIAIVVGLNAVIVAVTDDTPRVLTVQVGADDPLARLPPIAEGLPSGSLDPLADRTLDRGMRRWVHEQTGIDLGYIEQLYTYGDRDRLPDLGHRMLSIAYLALVRERAVHGSGVPVWRPWYDYFPWEDWRAGQPGVIEDQIAPALRAWVGDTNDGPTREQRLERAEIAFGLGEAAWNPNRALDRYELLYEAGLIPESAPQGDASSGGSEPSLGRRMAFDHRRIVASALDRMRGKLSYRPVVFELLPEVFTLLQLQRVVEAVVGLGLHKSNFRRLVEQAQLVERTGTLESGPRGRPAERFRFRREVLRERPAPGVALPRRIAR